MQKDEVAQKLRTYFIDEVLGGKDASLDVTTPLLEWGIINSFEMIRLLHYIHSEFGIDIPPEEMIADYFKDIVTITNLICEHTHASK